MSLGRQSFWGILIKGFSILVAFVLVAMLARVLSPAEYGIYSVVLALITVLTVPTALGLPNYVVREIAAAMGRDKKAGADGETAGNRRWRAASCARRRGWC